MRIEGNESTLAVARASSVSIFFLVFAAHLAFVSLVTTTTNNNNVNIDNEQGEYNYDTISKTTATTRVRRQLQRQLHSNFTVLVSPPKRGLTPEHIYIQYRRHHSTSFVTSPVPR